MVCYLLKYMLEHKSDKGMKQVFIFLILLIVGLGLKAQNIIKGGEYWFDEDFANRQSIVLLPGENILVKGLVDVSSLNYGLHAIHARFLDNENVWSSVSSEFFIIKSAVSGSVVRKIVSSDIWFDADFENRVSQSVSAVTDYSYIQNFDVSVLKPGVHIAHCRFKDSEGVWSSVKSSFFVTRPESMTSASKDIVSFEYWIDSNFNGRISDQISAASALNLNLNIDVTRVNNGLHVLHYRFKDSEDGWSSVVSKFFVTKSGISNSEPSNVVSYRYWIDGEEMIESDIESKAEDLIFVDSLELFNVKKGEHLITMQFKNSSGIWSSAITDTIVKQGFPIAYFKASQTLLCDSATLLFNSESIDADTLLWSVNNNQIIGDTSLSYLFQDPGMYNVELTAVDTTLHIDSLYSIQLFVDSIPKDLIQDESFAICQGDSIKIEAVPNYAYSWNTGETDQSVYAKSEQWYIVEATSANECKNEDSVFVVVNQLPQINLGDDKSILDYEQIVLDAGSDYSTYEWSDESSEQLNTILGHDIGIGDHEIYVTVTDDNNCVGTDTILITVNIHGGIDGFNTPEIKLYPVPVKDILTIEIPESLINSNVRVNDASGDLIYLRRLNEPIHEIGMENLASGMYIISFENDELNYKVKIIKE